MSSPRSTAQGTSTLSIRGTDLAAGPDARADEEKLYGKAWDPETNPDGIVNIGTAENLLIIDDVAAYVASQNLQFKGIDFDYGEGPWGSLKLRTAMSNFLNVNFHPHTPTSPSNITITAGATSLLSTLALTLANPTDAVLLPAPCYVGFSSDLSLLAGLTPVYVRFPREVDQFTATNDDAAVRCYETAYRTSSASSGLNVKMLILCNPHNPLGRCYTRAALISIMQFCARHEIHLVVDEVYAMSVYSTSHPGDIPFTSVLSIDTGKYIPPTHLHHIYSLSKDFASGGLRVASLHTRNAALQRAVARLANFHHSGTVSAMVAGVLLAPPAGSRFDERLFETSRERLKRAAEFAKVLLDERGIGYAEGANAGLFLWIDLRPWLRVEDGEDVWAREKGLSKRMEGEKVFLIGAAAHGAVEAGWFRFVFSRREDVIKEGVRRLTIALGERQ